MQKSKKIKECAQLNYKEPIKALFLLATLKDDEHSNTKELSETIIENLSKFNVSSEIIRLVNFNILPGLKSDMGNGDQWPEIESKIRETDIVIFATPIWWGIQSSIMQRAIERMDALDEEYRNSGKSPLYNKVGGIVITGSEDGAQHIIGNLCNFLQWSGLTLPPECACYWVGEVGTDHSKDAEKRRSNKAVKVMAYRMARNLAYYSKLLKIHPLQEGN